MRLTPNDHFEEKEIYKYGPNCDLLECNKCQGRYCNKCCIYNYSYITFVAIIVLITDY